MSDLFNLIASSIDNALSNIHTSTIAKVVAVNSTTLDLKPVFKRSIDGVDVELPIFREVPVITLQGGSSHIAMPVSVGDYALVFFTERCYDGWYAGNDNNIPMEYRMHDYSDGFALIGINNMQNGISIPSLIQVTGDLKHDGDTTENGNEIKNGNLTINGNLIVNNTSGGSATLNNTTLTINNGDVIADGISLKNHIHVGDSGGNTSPPVG